MRSHPVNHREDKRSKGTVGIQEFTDLESPNGYLLSIRCMADIDADTIDNWKALERFASEPNPYLSADFIIPAARHLSNPRSLTAVAISDSNGCLRGILILTERPANTRFPFRHYALFKSPHSFLGGLLIDKHHKNGTLEAITYFFRSKAAKYQALYIDDLYMTSEVYNYLSNMAFSGVYPHDSYRRAVIDLAQPSRTLAGELGRKKVKDLERCKRNLGNKGTYHWRITEGAEITERTVDTFLSLEHKGWKGEHKTSIRSSPSEEAFFREMIQEFSKTNRIFFTEILVDDMIIASTCNFRMDDKVFAFKVSWDSDFRSFSPGMLNEYEFLCYLDGHGNSVRYVDSGSSHDSYIERLWPDRVHIVNGYCLFSRPLLLMTSVLSTARSVVRAYRRYRQHLMSIVIRRGQ